MITWRVFCKLLLCFVSLMLLPIAVVHADEYGRYEDVTPPSVKKDKDSLEGGLKEKKILLPKLGDWIEELPKFWSKSSLTPHFRAYSFSRRFSDDEDPEAIAMGGELRYRSAQLFDRFNFGASYYISHGVHDDGGDGTLLLGSNASDLNVLGQLYFDLYLKDFRLRFYRQAFDLPYLNKQDSRMIPNTHEAVVITREGNTVNFIAGQVTDIKRRDSESFISMAEAAGVGDPDRGGRLGDLESSDNESDRGTSMAGLRYRFGDNSSIGAINYYTWDTFNIFYTEFNFLKEWNEKVASKINIQFTHQDSIGDDLIGEFHTNHYGVRVRTSYKNSILTLAATNTGSGNAIQSPFGGRPSYLSLMRRDFDRANEVGFLVGLSYDFSRLGLPGLSAFTNFAWGNNAENPQTNESLPDVTEYDFTVDYRPTSGLLNGIWLRTRYAHVDLEGGKDTQDVRVILNYELKL